MRSASHLKGFEHSFVRAAETELEIGNNKYNESMITRFSIPAGSKVKHMTIGDNSLQKVVAFELKGLGELESVVIRKNSLTENRGVQDIEASQKGSCRIVDCPKLVSLAIGDFSMSGYKELELRGLDSLQSVEMNLCFCYAESFALKSRCMCYVMKRFASVEDGDSGKEHI